MPSVMSAAAAIGALPANARVLAQGAAGESRLLADALVESGRADVCVTGVFIPGVNTHDYGAASGRAVTTFFLTPQLKAAGPSVTFLPLGYNDIAAYLAAQSFDAAFMTLSSPDKAGVCSFGVAVDFTAELWRAIPLLIAHINPNMPFTHGFPGVRHERIAVAVEAETPLPVLREPEEDAGARAVAAHVAALTPDGATLEVGVGKLPGACMRALVRKRGLRIHSGMVGDWILPLREAGALADAPIVCGIALGGERLYRAAASPDFSFQPVSVTHSPASLARLERFIAINAALEVDLLGQAHAEAGPDGLISGPGGALDFARGARAAGGLRIVVLNAAARAGAVSRIAPPGAGKGPVSLSRFDVDVVVTEHGAADLRALSHDARAERLIGIAAPVHRPALARAWDAYRRDILV